MGAKSLKGRIFDIERFAIYDGTGIRTTVFFKGCPLRCAWCQNPEGMNPQPETLFYEYLCAGCGRCVTACSNHAHEAAPRGRVFHRDRCKGCGRCAAECMTGALAVAGREVTVEEVMEVILRDRAFYERSGGGVTLSGGEPMAQPEFAAALLSAAKRKRLHTAVDTSGSARWAAFEKILPYVDLFLFDVKDTDAKRHMDYTGGELEPVLDNLRRLDAAGAKTVLRAIIVPGVNDCAEHRARLTEIRESLTGCIGLEILQYHRLGLPKWKALGRAGCARDFSCA